MKTLYKMGDRVRLVRVDNDVPARYSQKIGVVRRIIKKDHLGKLAYEVRFDHLGPRFSDDWLCWEDMLEPEMDGLERILEKL